MNELEERRFGIVAVTSADQQTQFCTQQIRKILSEKESKTIMKLTKLIRWVYDHADTATYRQDTL
jgi:hypothetical protein